ncbi:MAG TPA: hypothetical protein VGG19_20625 [Tepidisphaeraceae bacterium]|jgi:hypothetical protein
MSSIPIVAELVFSSDAALEQLRAFSQTVQSEVEQMRSLEVRIPLSIDNQASEQIDSLRQDITSNPISLPIQIDTASVQSQMDELRASIASTPIQVPLQITPGDDAGGGGGGGGAMFGGGGLRRLFIQLEMIRAGVDLAEAGDEIAKGWAFNRDEAHNEAEFEQYGHGAEAARKAALKDVDKIPIVGSVIADSADAINRFGGATKNFVEGKGFESDAGHIERMEGDTKAMEEHTKKLHEEAEARGKVVESLHKSVENSDLTATNAGTRGSFDREINSIDAARLDVMQEYRWAGQNASNAKNFDKHGNLLPEAVTARDAAMHALDAREDHARDDLNNRAGHDADETQLMRDELSGDSAAERKDKFRLLYRQEHDAAYAKSKAEGEAFDKTIGPLMQSQFPQDEKHRTIGLASEAQYTKSIGIAREHEYEAEQARDPQAEAKARNEAIDANVQKLKDAAANEIDKEKQKLLVIEASAAASDAYTEKLKNNADALREVADRTYEFNHQLADLKFSTQEKQLRSDDKNYDADKKEIEHGYEQRNLEYKRQLDDKKISQSDYDRAIKESYDDREADYNLLDHGRQKQFRNIQEKTYEYQWESQNRPRMAELSRIESELGEQLRDATGDPEKERYLRQEGAAQLEAFAHPRQTSQWYSSAGDYAHALQTGVLNQDGQANHLALEVVKELKDAGIAWKQALEDAHKVTIAHDWR